MCPAEICKVIGLNIPPQHVRILDVDEEQKFGWKYVKGTQGGFCFVDTSSPILPYEVLPGDPDLSFISSEGKFIIRAISAEEAKKLRAKHAQKK